MLRYCHVCQMSKIANRNYGKLQLKDIDDRPWRTLCVDLIGPYKITKNVKKVLYLSALTMIDPATGWIEIVQIPDKRSDTVANLVKLTWLTRYPRPLICICDRGKEFIGKDFKNSLLKQEYNIECHVASRSNPQTNSILERAHQVIGNQIRALELNSDNIDLDDPWSGVLGAVAFAIRSTYHTTLQATPGQLVFKRDMILPTTYVANWHQIRQNKLKRMKLNLAEENKKRLPYKYKIGELIKVKKAARDPKLHNLWEGPYKITKISPRGTIFFMNGAVEDQRTIRQIHPYNKRKDKSDFS